MAPGGSGLHISGHFLEVRGERSVRNCAEMERGEKQNQAMERVKRCACVYVRVYGHSNHDSAYRLCARCSSHISSFDPGNNPLMEYQLFLQLNKVRLRRVE